MTSSSWYTDYAQQWTDSRFLFPWYQNDYQSVMRSLSHRWPQVVLLSGGPWTGLLKFACLAVAACLCEKPNEDFLPCFSCSSCSWMAAQSHPDFRLLFSHQQLLEFFPEGFWLNNQTSSQTITIDHVRSLTHFLSLSTHRGKRIVFIAPIEALSQEAAQALLKTLEEPCPHTLFFLMSYRPQSLSPTLLSRCQIHWRANTPHISEVQHWLAHLSCPVFDDFLMTVYSFMNRPGYFLLLASTHSMEQVREFSDALFQKSNALCFLSQKAMDLIRQWEPCIGSVSSFFVFLELLMALIRCFIQKKIDLCAGEGLSSCHRHFLLNWILFFDQVQKARYSFSSSLNQKLAIENIMAFHPLMKKSP